MRPTDADDVRDTLLMITVFRIGRIPQAGAETRTIPTPARHEAAQGKIVNDVKKAPPPVKRRAR